MATTYRKTAKGSAEIETRANKLVPRLRSVLILVDGKRTDDELRSLFAQPTDETLLVLVAQGFIEVVSVTDNRPNPRVLPTSAAPASASASEPAAAAQAGADFATFRRDVVRMLNAQVGPAAEPMAVRLERARSFDQLLPQLESARKMIELARGPQAASAFSVRFIVR